MDILNAKFKRQNLKTIILLVSVFICLLITVAAHAEEEVITKKFAIEMEYGSATFLPFPLDNIGQRLYGNNIKGTPFGGNVIIVIGPGIVIGFDYRSFGYGYDKGKTIYGNNEQWVIDNQVTITQFTPYIDLSSFALGNVSRDSIAKGIFIEIGPCFTELKEGYTIQGTGPYTNGIYEFTLQGVGLDIRAGYRTLTKEPISFFSRVKITVPLSSDNQKTDSGLQLKGAVTTSINIGLCLSF